MEGTKSLTEQAGAGGGGTRRPLRTKPDRSRRKEKTKTRVKAGTAEPCMRTRQLCRGEHPHTRDEDASCNRTDNPKHKSIHKLPGDRPLGLQATWPASVTLTRWQCVVVSRQEHVPIATTLSKLSRPTQNQNTGTQQEKSSAFPPSVKVEPVVNSNSCSL